VLGKVKEAFQKADMATVILEHPEAMIALTKIQSELPEKIAFEKIEAVADETLKSIYLTIQASDEGTYNMLANIVDLSPLAEKILPILYQEFGKIKGETTKQ
jgi:hypothetical protein